MNELLEVAMEKNLPVFILSLLFSGVYTTQNNSFAFSSWQILCHLYKNNKTTIEPIYTYPKGSVAILINNFFKVREVNISKRK